MEDRKLILLLVYFFIVYKKMFVIKIYSEK